jgi:hypothetical protein
MPTELPENFHRIWVEVLPGMDPQELEARLAKGMNREIRLEVREVAFVVDFFVLIFSHFFVSMYVVTP